jgi:2-hydroxychromene-2-carboxylate isomerase
VPAPLEIDVFWSFRSPWSYLATPRLVEWQKKYQLDIHFRPVYPLAIRTPEFFDGIHPLWPRYFMTDVFRVAEYLGLPFAPPQPDPVVQEISDGRFRTAAEQPFAPWLTRLGVIAEEAGSGLAFADEVSRLVWSGTPGWNEGSHLADAAGRAGLDLEELQRIDGSERQRIEAVIEQNHVDHEAAGHWGVPTCAFQGEPFFGQDRLDVLLWRLRQNGLEER